MWQQRKGVLRTRTLEAAKGDHGDRSSNDTVDLVDVSIARDLVGIRWRLGLVGDGGDDGAEEGAEEAIHL